MSIPHIARLGAAAAFTLLVACAGAQTAQVAEPVDIASVDDGPGTPEFHGARIGDDTLRSRIED